MNRPVKPLACSLALALGATLALGTVPSGAKSLSGSSQTPPAEAVVNQAQDERTRKEIEKLQAEIDKLRAEKDSLELENLALGVGTRKWSAIVGAIGGFTGAILTFLIGYAGIRLSRAQEARASQDKKLTQTRLNQDKALAREKQTLEIYRDLGHSSQRTQIAAASLLLQRLQSYTDKKASGQEIDELEELEHPTIIKVLVSVLKEKGASRQELEEPEHPTIIKVLGSALKEKGTSRQDFETLRKYIADNLVKVIGTPLRKFDWQKTNLARVWWKGEDASGVDFYQANLTEAGFADTNLQHAVFYQADLRNAVLKNARLADANFFDAQLDGVILKGATYDDKTIWPEGFDPEAHGARHENHPRV